MILLYFIWRWAVRKQLKLIVSWMALLCLMARVGAQTFQHKADEAIALFGEGLYSDAYWAMESIQLEFGEEPEFTTKAFQHAIMPLWAYAALLADRPTDALVYFSEILLKHAPSSSMRAFVLYNAAIAQSQAGALAAAAQTFRVFKESYPGSNEAALALLQEADLLYEIGESEQSLILLNEFYGSEGPHSLRMQARLRALQIAGEIEDTEQAQALLFETNWDVSAMPDIAVLSFAALDAGDLLLSDGQYAAAIRAYRLTLPHLVLIEKQTERLEVAQLAQSRQTPYASAIWRSHSAQVIARLKTQLERLEAMEDYTPGLFLRSGQAYLLGTRYREATILFREIAQNETFERAIRAEAHYRWILALSEADKWSEARLCAADFLEQHPEHSLANSALFLIARAFQGEGKYFDAIDVLDQLIENFPTDIQAARWYFARGYNYSVLEKQETARNNFLEGLEKYPKSPLVPQLKLWAALTFFFDRDYSTCLEHLNKLEKALKGQPVYPEILYRTANTNYAAHDYEKALKYTGNLIKDYADHHRVAEALALRGDIYMGLGELLLAVQAFKKVPHDDATLYDYSIFQISKIYKALGDYKLLRKHLTDYTDRDDANERPRVSEALYWIGWSLQQENRAEEAFPIYESALKRFGNDPKARSVESILSALADLYRRAEREPLDSNRDFVTWLQGEAERSLAENQLTRFARVTRFIAERQKQTIDTATADATLLSIHRFVPLEKQDPATLADIGIALANREYDSADDYFEYLLNEYPKRFERAAAYYGKAKLAAQKGLLTDAKRWLIRFLEETPTHSLGSKARLLSAEILRRQGLFDLAQNTLNEILALKEMRGRPHAQALAELAKIETEKEDPKRAIAYWQRIYTLYRGYPELLAEAYWESALLFEQIEDPIAARNTVQEFLRDERLKTYASYALAEKKLPALIKSAVKVSELAGESAGL